MGKSQKEIVAARKERIDRLIAEMTGQGYELEDLSVDGNTSNRMALLTGVIPSAVFVLLSGLLHGWEKFRDVDLLLILVVFLISIIVHEGIHGLFFGLFAKNHFKSIEFGMIWKSMNPYCYCGEPLSRKHYLTGLLMPGIILGCCTGMLGLITGKASLILFSVFSLFAAGGDIYIAWMIMKTSQKGREEKYLDHPDKPGVMMLHR